MPVFTCPKCSEKTIILPVHNYRPEPPRCGKCGAKLS